MLTASFSTKSCRHFAPAPGQVLVREGSTFPEGGDTPEAQPLEALGLGRSLQRNQPRRASGGPGGISAAAAGLTGGAALLFIAYYLII